MQSTTNIYEKNDDHSSLICKTILGVELEIKYIDKVKYHFPTICMDVRESFKFSDSSYDIVICTDVLEHLPLPSALYLLKDMKRIARKFVIIYTPRNFDPNGDNVKNAWEMGVNHLQEHKCLITQLLLEERDYKSEITDIDNNIFGVWGKNKNLLANIIKKN